MEEAATGTRADREQYLFQAGYRPPVKAIFPKMGEVPPEEIAGRLDAANLHPLSRRVLDRKVGGKVGRTDVIALIAERATRESRLRLQVLPLGGTQAPEGNEDAAPEDPRAVGIVQRFWAYVCSRCS